MKKIVEILKTDLKISKYHKKFYLSEVRLEDNEVYSLASSKIPVVGDEVESWFSTQWQKAKAKYPKRLDNN